MAADVSSLIRILNGAGDTSDPGKPTAGLITRDLLGGGGGCSPHHHHHLDAKELDLDVQVPSGWEKRLDLKSGKVYLQRCDSANSASSEKRKNNGAVSKFQDLNLLPSAKQQQPMNLFDDGSLDLKLVSASSSESPASPLNYQSVCTLDKVKSALQRAEKETMGKRSISMSMSKSPSPSRLSNSSSSIKDCSEVDDEEKSGGGSFAAGCPNCLLYVLISSNNPKCPGCNTTVPLPKAAAKKPRIDLNISI